MVYTVWRLRPLAVPAWSAACTNCPSAWLESTGRFRVNSNGQLHDVWLIYRCPRCGTRRKRSVHRRVREGKAGVTLDAYRRDDETLAVAHGFALCPGAPVGFAVERPHLPASGLLSARIVQPLSCAVRWDRLLAGELGWSRGRVRAAWESGSIRVVPTARPSRLVRDGQVLRVDLG